jgi:hypothetical protein
MRIIFLFITSIFTCQLIFAQATNPEPIQEEPTQPAILQDTNPTRDARLDKMLNWHIEKNQKINGMKGFRVEIFFSSEFDAKAQALDKKVEFLSKYPEYAVHIKYDAPNFRVRVGDFRTKNEALKLYKEIEKSYPVAFIVADKIEFPLLKQINYE